MAGRFAAQTLRAEISLPRADRVALARLVLAVSQKGVHDRRILGAIERVVASGKSLTPDLGGQAKTTELTEAIRSEI